MFTQFLNCVICLCQHSFRFLVTTLSQLWLIVDLIFFRLLICPYRNSLFWWWSERIWISRRKATTLFVWRSKANCPTASVNTSDGHTIVHPRRSHSEKQETIDSSIIWTSCRTMDTFFRPNATSCWNVITFSKPNQIN